MRKYADNFHTTVDRGKDRLTSDLIRHLHNRLYLAFYTCRREVRATMLPHSKALLASLGLRRQEWWHTHPEGNSQRQALLSIGICAVKRVVGRGAWFQAESGGLPGTLEAPGREDVPE
jgi:hypothetical protein